MSDTTTALAVRRPTQIVSGYNPPPSEDEFRGMIYMAKQLAEAQGFVPEHFYKQPFKIVAAILYGRDLGISATNALQHIIVIEGKAGADAQLIGMLVRRGGHHLGDVTTNESSTVTIKRGDTGEVFTATFGKADAERITIKTRDGYKKLAEQPAYKNYPRGMYYSRALTECARKGCQDALMGVAYTSEELDPTGTVVSVQTGEIPASLAAPESVAALEAVQGNMGMLPVPSPVQTTPPAVPEQSAGEVQVPVPGAVDVAAPAPPPSAPVAPLSGPALARRMGAGRSIGPAPKRTNVVTVEQGPETPATPRESILPPVAQPDPVPSQSAQPALTDEPDLPAAVDDGLAPQRDILRQSAGELLHVNAILENVKRGLEGKEAQPVPSRAPSEASDAALASRIDTEWPGRKLVNLKAADLQNLLERFESNLAKKRALMLERGIQEE